MTYEQFEEKYRDKVEELVSAAEEKRERGLMPHWNYIRAWLVDGEVSFTQGREASPCQPCPDVKGWVTFWTCQNDTETLDPSYTPFMWERCKASEAEYYAQPGWSYEDAYPSDPKWIPACEFDLEEHAGWVPFRLGEYGDYPDLGDEIEECLRIIWDAFEKDLLALEES